MLPSELKPASFSSYPPLGREVAVRRINLLRQLPLSFVPLLLREVQIYDWNFPSERQEIDAQFTYLDGLTAQQLQEVMRGFTTLQLPVEMEQIDWVNSPLEFSERLSAQLWITGKIAAFRTAAIELLNRVHTSVPSRAPESSRCALVVLGQGVRENNYKLFRKLRPEGTYFTNVNPKDGLSILMEHVADCARKHPARFAHWYVDGGIPFQPVPPGVEVVAYSEIEPLRSRIVATMHGQLIQGQATEARRSGLAKLGPADFGLDTSGTNAILNRFKVSILAEGSGTQFFSTTFVQWSVRELLRRAQPLTVLARFAPRMTDLAMNEALSGSSEKPTLDADGALIDADMAAYYTWINLMRLSGASSASFLVWFEDHKEAVIVSPTTTRGGQSDQAVSISNLVDMLRIPSP